MTVDLKALNQLLEVIGDDHESLLELVESFLSDGPELLASMTGGLDAGDAPVVARSAHTLKSSARDFGLIDLSDTCLQLEKKSKAGDLSDAADLVSRIQSQFMSGRDALIKAAGDLAG